MFEKEAEEIVKRNVCGDCNRCQSHGYIGCDVYRYSKDSCLYGLRTGYNKANEWHFVKDGDLPKENGLLMSETLNLITKMKGSDCLSLALGQFNFSTQEFSYQHIVGLTDVIAWKEIVLPELKESE